MSEQNNKSFNFLLADDHSLIRQGLVFLLEDMEENHTIFQASTQQSALEAVRDNRIDIAIIDAHFPDATAWLSCLKSNR